MSILSVDGFLDYAPLQISDDCCAPSACDIDTCNLVCNFINLLPSGPLWDEQKSVARAKYIELCGIGGSKYLPCAEEVECTGLVSHSIYTAIKLSNMVNGALIPAVFESDPNTAFTTMDDWLVRLGWIDCFACSPCAMYESLELKRSGVCGQEYCSPNYSKSLSNTLKHNILRSLSRLQMGIVKNIAAINFVIAPLQAKLALDTSCETNVIPIDCRVKFNLMSKSDKVELWNGDRCAKRDSVTIDAFSYDDGCKVNGVKTKLYPMLYAAECIVRSILPNDNKIKITKRYDLLLDPQ
jgi:hypothetical protein